MNMQHKIIREMLKSLPVPAATEILEINLKPDEAKAILYSRDVKDTHDLNGIAQMLNISERKIKQIRSSGYKKLAAIYFPKR